MKNILYLSRSGDFGGMEKHILDLINAVNKDYKVYVFSPNGPMISKYISAGANHYEAYPLGSFDYEFALKVRRFVIENQIDIVHTHELEVSVLGLMGLIGVKNVKKIMHVHTPITNWRHTFLNKIFKAPLNFIANFVVANFVADKVIALTAIIKNERIYNELVRPSKIVVIPNAVDTSDLQISDIDRAKYKTEIIKRYNIPINSTIIGNLGRMTIEKGYDLLIKAFATNFKNDINENVKYHLLLVGGGKLEDTYQTLVNDLGISDQVTITGKFNDEDKVKFYSTFDYMVFPSRAEGFGYVLCEAMYFGIPVLASDLPILKQVSDNKLMYFKTDNLDDLELKLSEFVELNVDTSEYKKALQAYSTQSFKKNYLSLYNLLTR